MTRRLVERLDTLAHRIGWCPNWLCDWHDHHITGEQENS
jgi:hypothetical protein